MAHASAVSTLYEGTRTYMRFSIPAERGSTEPQGDPHCDRLTHERARQNRRAYGTNTQTQWRKVQRTMVVAIIMTAVDGHLVLGSWGLKGSEAAKSGSVPAPCLSARFGRPSRHDSDSLASQGRLGRLRSALPRASHFLISRQTQAAGDEVAMRVAPHSLLQVMVDQTCLSFLQTPNPQHQDLDT